MVKQRDLTIDSLKGLAIILMIVGHLSLYYHDVIYSFHMPLFFIVAGYFFKPVPFLKGMKKDAKRLLVPYLIVAFITIFFWWISTYKFSPNVITDGATALLWANGTRHNSIISNDNITIGAIWFLAALFWTKTLYNIIYLMVTFRQPECDKSDFLQGSKAARFRMLLLMGVVCFIVNILSIVIDRLINLPLGILTGGCAILFYYCGWFLRTIDGFRKMNIWMAVVCLAVWYIDLQTGSLEIAAVNFGKYPALSCLGAVAATLFFYWVIDKLKISCLAYVGEVSLVILCIHKIITESHIRHILNLSFGWQQVVFDLVVITVLLPLISNLSPIKKIFGIKECNLLRSLKLWEKTRDTTI